MTSKDYVKIAEVLRRHLEEAREGDTREAEEDGRVFHGFGPRTSTTAVLVRRIATMLGDDNSRFNRSRFFSACGLEE